MSVVEIAGVVKRYAAQRVLDDVSLTIAEGEFFGLLGPSGSGKTTLLRAIAGFVAPEAGSIRIDAEDLTRVPVHRRGIGMVFQHYALFPHLSVFDNVAFGLAVRGTARAQVRARVQEMLRLVELESLVERRPAQLSGGQQQRVALARALVTRPRVLLLDEPLSALDKRLRLQMQVELRQIQREVGITTVFVTHDQEEALTLSDRIALLHEGRVVQCGAPAEVYERPRSVFAAQFLGAANFFAGRVAPDGDGESGAVDLDDGTRLFSAGTLPGPGQAVTLAVRPEKLLLGEGAPGGENVLSGTLVQAVYSGSSTAYYVQCGARQVTVFAQNRGEVRLEHGAAVSLSWSAADTVPLAPGEAG